MKHKIIPTVFAHNKKEFNERFSRLVKISKSIQIDFMDGRFVKNKGVDIGDIPNLKKFKIRFEAHLMTRNPEKYIKKLKEKGFKKIIFHYEAVRNNDKIEKLIKRIKYLQMDVMIAINPSTSIEKIIRFLDEIDGVLVMGVYPGREHQKFIKSVYNKIKRLRKINKKVIIQVDGGVNPNNISKFKEIGVNYINSGSFVGESDNAIGALRSLENGFS